MHYDYELERKRHQRELGLENVEHLESLVEYHESELWYIEHCGYQGSPTEYKVILEHWRERLVAAQEAIA